MKPSRFEYVRPSSLAEALDFLVANPDASLLAGGQSLVPMMNFRMSRPTTLIDINDVTELAQITLTDGAVTIGAMARHNTVLRSQHVREGARLLTLALPFVAHEAIRNRGTLGGSLALADPAAELPCCCVCLGAQIIAASHTGQRSICARDFFEGIYSTALRPDEIITQVRFPSFDGDWSYSFDEIARRRGDFAMAGLAMAGRFDNGKLSEVRLSYCGVEGGPRRLAEIEERIVTSNFESADFFSALHADLADTLEPLDSTEILESYRKHLAAVLLERGLRSLLGERSASRAEEPSALLQCTVNGKRVRALAPVRSSLVDWIRHGLGLTGTHVGCEHGVCGACNILVDGSVVRGCLMLTVQVEGRHVETIEGASESGRIEILQKAFFCKSSASVRVLRARNALAGSRAFNPDQTSVAR